KPTPCTMPRTSIRARVVGGGGGGAYGVGMTGGALLPGLGVRNGGHAPREFVFQSSDPAAQRLDTLLAPLAPPLHAALEPGEPFGEAGAGLRGNQHHLEPSPHPPRVVDRSVDVE